MSLTNQNVIQSLITNDPEIKAAALKKLQDQLSAAQNTVAGLQAAIDELSDVVESKAVTRKKKLSTSKKALPGTKNHRQAIVSVVTNKPGMIISEVRAALEAANHEIDKKTLASLICSMAKSEKEIRSAGDRPTTKYFPVEKND